MCIVRMVALLFMVWMSFASAAAQPDAAPLLDRETPAKPSSASKAQASEPTLDLERLEKRLKETEAIGFFTKLTLKNEVDDLLARFRAYHEGNSTATPEELRRPYETLILKVLSLLQDADPPLAKEILRSREALWAILTDRDKFARL